MENLYICLLPSWNDTKKGYLVCKKVITTNTKGKQFIGYEVVTRVTAQGYNEPMKETDSLKGVYYSEGEIKIIEPLN